MEGISEIKSLVEKQGTAWEEFKSANDARLEAIEKKGWAPADLTEKVDKINGELTALSKQINEAVKLSNRPGQPGALTSEQEEHKKAFAAWARKGEKGNLRELERKAISAGSDPDGGFFATQDIEAGIERMILRDSAMMSLATMRVTSSGQYKKRVRISGAGYKWVGEGEAPGETATPKYAELTFEAAEIAAEPMVSTRSLEDLDLPVEQEIMDSLEEDFTDGAGAAFITGDGIAKPRGLLSYDTVDNSTWEWGKVGFVKTGGANGFASTNPSDALISVIHALRRGYRAEAAWIMNDLTLATIRKFKDGQGLYLWQPGLQAGVPGQLLGYNVNTDDNMPDLNTDTFPVAFGNFRRAYVIVKKRGIVMLRDPYTAKGWVKYYTTMCIGGGIQNFQAVKLLKCAA